MNINITNASATKKEIVTFSDQNTGFLYDVPSPLESTYTLADNNEDSLQSFFSRPIKIKSFGWGTTTQLYETFNPWQDFWENPRVINRIANYNLLRCTMKLKFVLNGNGFHYGRVIAAYTPLALFDGLTKDRGPVQADITEASQRPHLYLDPTNSEGGEMHLPFVWENNALDVPDQDWRGMGEVSIRDMTPLKHANGSTDTVTISVFAWAENVVMSTPTSNEPGAIAAQSGEYVPGEFHSSLAHYEDLLIANYEDKLAQVGIAACMLQTLRRQFHYTAQAAEDPIPDEVVITSAQAVGPSAVGDPPIGSTSPPNCKCCYTPQSDEYVNTAISGPASTIARIAGKLISAPLIGPYAKATSIGASAVASIARIFGYSRPIDISDIQPYKPTYLGNMTNTNVTDSATKLSMDVKQELTCDTRTMGLSGDDEMSIRSIASRESYLTSFAWTQTAAAETLLWNAYVTPGMSNQVLFGGVQELHMPAMYFVSLPFKYWRGTLKYRFQIVASAFHKGRLKIVYDPSYFLTNEYNTNFTKIVDLAEQRDFTVEVGWGQQTPFLLRSLGDSPKHSTLSLGPSGPDSNGILAVYVVNELTTPSDANNDIAINVFVSAADDFEVAVPDEQQLRSISWYAPQSGEYLPQAGENVPDSDNTIMEDAPMNPVVEEHLAAPLLSQTDHTMDVFIGDPITSIRQVLKRYCFSRALDAGTEPGHVMVNYSLSDFPLPRGYAPDAVFTDGGTPYNFTGATLLNYFTPAFLCARGGIRWKYQLCTDCCCEKSYMNVVRNSSRDFEYGKAVFALPKANAGPEAFSYFWTTNSLTFIDGGHATAAEQNPVIEVELPYYFNKRFSIGKTSRVIDAYGYHDLNFTVKNGLAAEPSSHHVQSYVAAAEDFTLGFYLGPPVAFIYDDPVRPLVVP